MFKCSADGNYEEDWYDINKWRVQYDGQGVYANQRPNTSYHLRGSHDVLPSMVC